MRYPLRDYITVVVLALLMGYTESKTHWASFPLPLPLRIVYRAEGGIRRRLPTKPALRSEIWGKYGAF